MNYYEIKVDVLRDDKTKSEVYLTKQESLIFADAVAQQVEPIEVTGISKKNYTDVFDDATKKFFYECKVEFESLDGNPIKETYIQKADSLDEARLLLLMNLDNEPEFKLVKETNIVDYLITE